jgi:predicted HAD superfamily phosphohydrolase YqeG
MYPWHVRLVPDFVAPSAADIDFGVVRSSLGLADSTPLHVFSDLDGTVRVVGEDRVHEPAANHVRNSLDGGIISSFTITSNSVNPTVGRFGHQIGDEVRTYSTLDTGCSKPNPAFFRHAMAEQGIGDEPVLVIGDKVTRDILGARRVGGNVVSLLVPRLGETDLPADRIVGRRFDVAAGMVGAALLAAANRYSALLDMV